ncbi:MAG TPA: ribonuclease E/G, partial [Thermoanaerobaculia bacterium]|nr:ribonuclease E/G [Thermoanaerobaculia bacterium]
SGRSTRAATPEETAVHTNVEAAAEVARQLRLRDLGGIVVVDFIDMRASKNQRKVEKALKDALKADKARTTVGRVSPNGLLEINRQRIQQALQLRTHRPCPTCNGVGSLASEEMVSLSLLRRIEARAATGSIQGARICLHPELADALQNHYRRELAALEEEFDIDIEIVAAAGLHRPDERIEWKKRERPAPTPKPRPAPITLQAWDLALPEDEEDEEEDEILEGKAGGEGEAQPGGGDAQKARRRRRGGRKRKKKGPGENGQGGAHPASSPQAEAPPEAVSAGGDEEGDDFEGDEDDFEDGPEAAEGESAGGAPGTGGPRKRRRRRRRRK